MIDVILKRALTLNGWRQKDNQFKKCDYLFVFYPTYFMFFNGVCSVTLFYKSILNYNLTDKEISIFSKDLNNFSVYF